MKKSVLAITLAAFALPAAPALADPPPWAPAHGHRAKQKNDYYRTYDRYGRYSEPRVIRRSDRIWRGRDGRYYCRRDNGTTGLIIGGAVGALIGRELDGGRDRTVGTIIGAAGGALLGRSIDRGDLRCR
ncbi:MAG: glycine zipper 2TM domain-containing protein [Novosphingobium sp.]